MWRQVGKVDQFKVGETVDVVFEDASPLPWAGVTARSAAWLRRDAAEEFTAYTVHCTHLGCPPNWLPSEQKFKCPCHGSGFYISGVNFEGPAPRPLERFRVVMADDGQILVDKSRKFQEELGQWKDATSFVTV